MAASDSRMIAFHLDCHVRHNFRLHASVSTYHSHLFGESMFRSWWYVRAVLALEIVLAPKRANIRRKPVEHVQSN
jgi:hypothetical protein